MLAYGHSAVLGEDVTVNAGIAAGNLDRSAVFLVEFARPNPADDAVCVADVAQGFERLEKQRLAKPAAARRLNYPRGAEKSALCRFVAGESDDCFVFRRDPAGNRLAR
jgi:hypothetical protein